MKRIPQPFDIVPEEFTRLPEALRYKGPPGTWAQMNRPGQNLHSFLEGACFDANGHLWLVDLPTGRLFSIAPDGQWTVEHQYEGTPHCHTHLADGRIVIADRVQGLLEFDRSTRQMKTLCSGVNSENFRALSDVAVAPNGDLWICDPGRSSPSDPTGRLMRLRPSERSPDIMLANIPYPNGVCISRDGLFVFVSVTRSNTIWRLRADAPDPVYPMVSIYQTLSGGMGPDGIAIDARGRLAVAHAQAGRAWLFDPLGDLLCRIRTPAGNWTTTVAFGPDERWLYIVEAQTATVYRADVGDLRLED